MALQTHLDKILEAKKAYDSAVARLNQKTIADALGEVIPEGFVLVFKTWTPGFNDGDPCTFTLGEPMLVTSMEPAGDDYEDEDDDDGYESDDGDPGDEQPEEQEEPAVLSNTTRTEFDLDPYSDNGVWELPLGDHNDTAELHKYGLTKKAAAEVWKLWKQLAEDETIIERAFGSDHVIAIHAGGKCEVDYYECGY